MSLTVTPCLKTTGNACPGKNFRCVKGRVHTVLFLSPLLDGLLATPCILYIALGSIFLSWCIFCAESCSPSPFTSSTFGAFVTICVPLTRNIFISLGLEIFRRLGTCNGRSAFFIPVMKLQFQSILFTLSVVHMFCRRMRSVPVWNKNISFRVCVGVNNVVHQTLTPLVMCWV